MTNSTVRLRLGEGCHVVIIARVMGSDIEEEIAPEVRDGLAVSNRSSYVFPTTVLVYRART